MSQRVKVVGTRSLVIWLLIIIAVVAVAALAMGGLVVYPRLQEQQAEQARLTQAEQHYQAGLAYQNAGDWEAAEAELRQVIALDANYKDVQSRLAEVRARLAESAATATAAAVAQAEQARAAARATATAQAKATAAAEASAVTATAEALEAQYQRGLGYINLERWAEAKAHLEQVFAIDPNYKEVQAKLAEVEAKLRELGIPTATLTPAPSLTPTLTLTRVQSQVPTRTPTPTNTPVPPTEVEIPMDGLVAYYSFDDGTAADNSGNGNNGKIHGDPGRVDGVIGRAFRFNTANDYVEVPRSASLEPVNSVTISAWVNPNTTDTWHQVVTKRFAELNDPYNSYILDTDGPWGGRQKWRFSISNGTPGSGVSAVDAEVIVVNQWTHLTGTYDGLFIKLYVNGILKATVRKTGGIGYSSLSLRIGRSIISAEPQQAFRGQIDEIRIYNRALDESEIQALYKQGESE